jgi:hypothetical protein
MMDNPGEPGTNCGKTQAITDRKDTDGQSPAVRSKSALNQGNDRNLHPGRADADDGVYQARHP